MITTYLNPISYLVARKNIKLYSNFDIIKIDGWLLVFALNIFTNLKMKRHSFDMTSDAKSFFIDSEITKNRIALVGTTQESLEKFIQIIRKKFPKLNIAYSRNGYFDDDNDRAESFKDIIKNKCDTVIIGMGVPLQEKYLNDLVIDNEYTGEGYTCGGFMHQTSENIDYYPYFINKYNLRMPYRFYKEKEFRSRFHNYILFPFYFIYDIILYKLDTPNIISEIVKKYN